MKKLYDFSASYLIMAVFTYAILLYLTASNYADTGKVLFAVLFALALVSGLFLLFFFVLLPIRLEEKQVRHGAKIIPRGNLSLKLFYDERFKEAVVLLKDTRIDYGLMTEKEINRKAIRLQATKRNLTLLSEYTGETLKMPEKPRKKRTKI